MKPTDESRRAFLDATEADQETVRRLLAARPRRRPTAGALGGATAVLAMAALLLVGIRLGIGTPEPELTLALADEGQAEPHPRFSLDWRGTGTVSGRPSAPRIEWQEGTITLSVVPGRETALSVVTDEAVVTVKGTRFTVSRGSLGTEVVVTEGRVGVACARGETFLLDPGQSAACAPVRAAPLLRRARALHAEHPDEALLDVERALRDAERPGLLDDELRALRVALLARTGNREAALAEALAYVAAGGTRDAEVARIGLSLGPGGDEACRLRRAAGQACEETAP